MASEFSTNMARKVGHIILGAAQAAAFDAELAEVRDVLDGLVTRRWKGNEPIMCWCDAIADDEHRAICQRARALYERLEVK